MFLLLIFLSTHRIPIKIANEMLTSIASSISYLIGENISRGEHMGIVKPLKFIFTNRFLFWRSSIFISTIQIIVFFEKYKKLRKNFENDGDYVKTWFLHHVLDYMEKVLKLDWISFEDSLQRLEERMKSCEELEEVKEFLRDSKESVYEDLRIEE